MTQKSEGYADIFLLKAPDIEYDIPNILIEFKLAYCEYKGAKKWKNFQ